MDTLDQPRKRTSERAPTSPSTSSTPPHASTTRDYGAISPVVTRDQQSGTRDDGTSGALQKAPRNREAEREAAAVEQRDKSRWGTFWEKYGSVELENKGSVARDHLALGTLLPSIII
jgi:hypothetical protein